MRYKSRIGVMHCVLIPALLFAFAGSLCAADDRPSEVKITVVPQTVISSISPDFVGFGYETSAVAQANYFSGKNASLIQLYRNLGDHGMIRIGGLVSDNTQYIPDGTPVARSFHEQTIINQQNLANLGDFARATGWKVMWGLNLGTGSKEDAVKEAIAVNSALGAQLHSFQIGNEVEDLGRLKKSYDAYHAAYVEYKSAVREAIPKAPFSGPDSVGHWDWMTKFAASESADIQLLTHHYYCSDAHNPSASMEKMLSYDERFEKRLTDLQNLSRQSNVRYRINEVNSFSGGGKPGVSDTFASALWCLDYMFMLASHNCEGINVETDINQHTWISHYSPIVHDETGRCTARPDYYGMLAFAMAGKGNLLKLTLDKGPINVTAYATGNAAGEIWLVVVNKDLDRDATVETPLPAGYATAENFALKAPSAQSKDGVTLAGAQVSADGKWNCGPGSTLPAGTGVIHVAVPRASAALVRLRK